MRSLTLTKEELETIKNHVEDCYLEVEFKMTKANLNGGRWGDMEEANELFFYTYLLRDIDKSWGAQNDTYASILTNRDIMQIHNKSLSLRAKINRL